jgi:hypothetical protein
MQFHRRAANEPMNHPLCNGSKVVVECGFDWWMIFCTLHMQVSCKELSALLNQCARWFVASTTRANPFTRGIVEANNGYFGPCRLRRKHAPEGSRHPLPNSCIYSLLAASVPPITQ